jgi:hypothetical protein
MEVRKTYSGHDVHHAVRLSQASRTGRHLPGSSLDALDDAQCTNTKFSHEQDTNLR